MKKLESAPSRKIVKKSPAEDLTTISGLLDTHKNLLNEINDKYWYWDKVKYQKVPKGYSTKNLWIAVKWYRRANAQSLSFGNYKFGYTLTNLMQNQLHLFDMHIGGNLGSISLVDNSDKNMYLVSSIMEEAIASSQIEGAVTTRKIAKEMLNKGRSPKNESERMIVNNYKTIQHILTIKKEPLTPGRLLEIHRMVTQGTLAPEEAGHLRRSNDVNVVDVIDGEIVYSPPAATELEGLVQDLCNFFNEDKHERFIHPIVNACIIHFMLGYIHPFTDGNGRTARALFYWYLLSKNYWLTEYLSISRLIIRSKVQYAKAFLYTETDENDLSYFIHYKLRVMSLAFEELKAYIQKKIDEKKQVVQFQRINGVNERQAMILKWMHEEPGLLLTVKEIVTRFVVSKPTANHDLSELAGMGFLEILPLNKKTFGFTKSKNFERKLRAAMKR